MVDHTNDQSTGVQSQEGLLHDVDPSLTEANEVAKALDVDTNTGLSSAEAQRRLEKFGRTSWPARRPYPSGRSSWRSSRIRWCTCCLPPLSSH